MLTACGDPPFTLLLSVPCVFARRCADDEACPPEFRRRRSAGASSTGGTSRSSRPSCRRLESASTSSGLTTDAAATRLDTSLSSGSSRALVLLVDLATAAETACAASGFSDEPTGGIRAALSPVTSPVLASVMGLSVSAKLTMPRADGGSVVVFADALPCETEEDASSRSETSAAPLVVVMAEPEERVSGTSWNGGKSNCTSRRTEVITAASERAGRLGVSGNVEGRGEDT